MMMHGPPFFRWTLFLLSLLTSSTFAYVCDDNEPVSDNPVIGIVAIELWNQDSMSNYSYIAASYVKYLESTGAQVVPLPLDQPDQYYLNLYEQLNGVLFPGGGVYFNDSDYTRVCNLFFQKALHEHQLHLEEDEEKEEESHPILIRKQMFKKQRAKLTVESEEMNSKSPRASNQFPIWGTCLGMEMLAYLAANHNNLTFNCRNQDVQSSLDFTMTDNQLRTQTSLFHGISDEQLKPFHKSNNTISYHSHCLAPELFDDPSSPIGSLFQALATGKDTENQVYVSIFEGRKMPIYASQFHPEKPLFEFVRRTRQRNIPHTQRAIQVGQYLANEFVHKTRTNRHCFKSRDDLQSRLIYNYQAEFSGSETSRYEQIYRFPLNRNQLN